MTDSYKPQDPGRVDITDPIEIDYWRREFDCTAEELVEAVAEVGTHTAEVRDCLHRHRRSAA